MVPGRRLIFVDTSLFLMGCIVAWRGYLLFDATKLTSHCRIMVAFLASPTPRSPPHMPSKVLNTVQSCREQTTRDEFCWIEVQKWDNCFFFFFFFLSECDSDGRLITPMNLGSRHGFPFLLRLSIRRIGRQAGSDLFPTRYPRYPRYPR